MRIKTTDTPDRVFSNRLDMQNRAFRMGFADQRADSPVAGDQQAGPPGARNPAKRRYGFLLLPGFSMLGISSALSALSAANQLSATELCQWTLFSADGGPVRSADGISVGTDGRVEEADLQRFDALIIGGGSCDSSEARLSGWLKRAAQLPLTLGAFGDGSLLLARLGLLDGYRCAAHWDYLATLREQFPRVSTQPRFFTIDRNRITSCGGSSSLDLMLELISRDWGENLAIAISESLVCERIRDGQNIQPAPLRSQLGDGQPQLTEAIALMEANLEEPVKLEDLHDYVHISRRKLERLFQKYLGCSPSRYYLELRLTRARQLLARTDKSVVEVSIASGFSSGTHFSRCFRQFFGVSPREARKRFWQGALHNQGDMLAANAAAPASIS